MAAVHNRRRHLLRLGRRKHEHRVRRRLLQGLQKRVPGGRREHVRLVEDVHLAASRDGRVGNTLAQFANVVDRVVRRRIHLDHIQGASVRDRQARFALPTGIDRRALAHSSNTPPGSLPSRSFPSRASRRTNKRGAPFRAPRRCAACAPPAPGRPRRRRYGDGACDTGTELARRAGRSAPGLSLSTPVGRSGERAVGRRDSVKRITCALVPDSVRARESLDQAPSGSARRPTYDRRRRRPVAGARRRGLR